jgi:hypothetical protein
MGAYILESGDRIKVGCSMDPAGRCIGIAGETGRPCRLAWSAHSTGRSPRRDGYALEKVMHAALADSALGHEWFSCSVEAAIAAAEAADPELFARFELSTGNT